MADGSARASIAGELKQWHKITLNFDGPERGEDAGTFLDHRLDVTFRHAGTGQTITVPGYFAADGRAAQSGATEGSVWRAHFNAPKEGAWTWEASFRTGDDIAVAGRGTSGGSGGAMDGASGTINVGGGTKSGADLRSKGLLEYDGDQYLNFAGDGSTFLKSGVGSPENFLAYKGFDNTPGSHAYKPHERHFDAGDPTWSGGEGRGIIGAVNYLADQGVNSAYMLLMNVGGDGQDVWPWAADDLGKIRQNAASKPGQLNLTLDARAFDVSKLDQWEIVFEHMQKKGIVLHLFLQETENDHLLNDGDVGVERALFLREMVARFGHHNGIIWNLGEENTNTAGQIRAQSAALKAIDPYDHPVAMHTYPTQHDRYEAHQGSKTLDVLSFQTQGADKVPDLDRYLGGAEKAGRPVVAFMDEQANASTGAAAEGDPGWQANHDTLRDTLWRFYADGGSGAEWYFGYKTGGGSAGDLVVEDFSTRESVYAWAAHARRFFEDLPLERMRDADGLTSGTTGTDQVRAVPGEVYAIYLPEGGSAVLDLSGEPGTYAVTWFDPLSGALRDGSVETVAGGGKVSIGEPPHSAGREWAVLVERTSAQPPKNPPVTETPDPDEAPVVDGPSAETPPKEDPVAGKDFTGAGVGTHKMKNGLVVMQAEDGKFVIPGASGNAAWDLETGLKGYKGDGYLLFDTKTDYFSDKAAGTAPTGPLKYTFRIDGDDEDVSGRYFISLRAMKPVTGEGSDRNNDFYVAVNPIDEGPSGWKKVFWSGSAEKWLWGTTYDANHKKSPAAFEVDGAGDYTIYISGRSRQAGLDEIHIQKGSKSTDAGAPTSDLVSGGTKPAPKPQPQPEPDGTDEEGRVDAVVDGLKFTAADVASAGGKSSITFATSLLLANDGGDIDRIEIVRDAMRGTVSLSKDGASLTYTYDPDQAKAKDAFAYRAIGEDGSSDTARVYLNVPTEKGGATPATPGTPTTPAEPKPGKTPDATPEPASEGTITLIDARSDKALVTLGANTVIEAASVKGLDLAAAAKPAADGVESAALTLGGRTLRVENEAPYAFHGDTKGDYAGGLSLKDGGTIKLGATFYALDGAKGATRGEVSASITVDDGTLKGRANAADVFVFHEGKMGRDTVEGFEARDTLAFLGDLGARQILDRASVSGGDTVIDFGGGDVLTLKDFAALGLDDILA